MAETKKTKEKEQTSCTDNNCPIHGNISLRGRTFTGKVLKDIFQKTANVEWEKRKFVSKYARYEKSRTRVKAHSSSCLDIKKGDTVKIMESRPISKTKNFVIIEKIIKEK